METHKNRKHRDQARLGSAERCPVSREAVEAFRRPAYQSPHRKAYKMSDPVPEWIVQAIRGQNEDVAEYVARRRGIGETDDKSK